MASHSNHHHDFTPTLLIALPSLPNHTPLSPTGGVATAQRPLALPQGGGQEPGGRRSNCYCCSNKESSRAAQSAYRELLSLLNVYPSVGTIGAVIVAVHRGGGNLSVRPGGKGSVTEDPPCGIFPPYGSLGGQGGGCGTWMCPLLDGVYSCVDPVDYGDATCCFSVCLQPGLLILDHSKRILTIYLINIT